MLSYYKINMQSFTLFKKFATKIIVLLILSLSFFLSTVSARAVDEPAAVNQGEELNTSLDNELANCPEAIRNFIKLSNGTIRQKADGKVVIVNAYNIEPDGTYIVGKDPVTGDLIVNCGNGQGGQQLLVRVFVLLVIIIILVFVFAVARSAILIMTSAGDPEKFGAAVGSLQTSIFSLIGIIVSYMLIVFIMTGIVGIGRTEGTNYNLICGQRIVIQLTFESNPDTTC
jgi:hypothetical protein